MFKISLAREVKFKVWFESKGLFGIIGGAIIVKSPYRTWTPHLNENYTLIDPPVDSTGTWLDGDMDTRTDRWRDGQTDRRERDRERERERGGEQIFKTYKLFVMLPGGGA